MIMILIIVSTVKVVGVLPISDILNNIREFSGQVEMRAVNALPICVRDRMAYVPGFHPGYEGSIPSGHSIGG